MKQYLLSVVTPTGGEPPSPEALKEIMTDVAAFHDELKAAGAWVFAGGLHAPDTATVVRVTGGETVMTDGPYIEGKEYLGGICIVKAPDLDAALEWGRKAATAIPLPIEVRPFVDEESGR
ncbi:MAG: YciI family protein [Actinomycetia bacterium]|nr:YciI family protein [Actinomycetes bacterium]MCL2733101.1 YciI family protein [Actinomycetes bacterium]